MEKYISCYALTEKCYYVAKDDLEKQAIEKMAEHIERAHDLKMTEEMREKAMDLLRLAA